MRAEVSSFTYLLFLFYLVPLFYVASMGDRRNRNPEQ
jgi:hypothetical protein